MQPLPSPATRKSILITCRIILCPVSPRATWQPIRCSTTVDGAINGNVFTAFVEQVIVPTFKPGDLVVIDNLSSHKAQRVGGLIASVGARRVFLPPYSPDLNPIELAFSKIKQRLRSLAQVCRDN